jgi:hypothetical protein
VQNISAFILDRDPGDASVAFADGGSQPDGEGGDRVTGMMLRFAQCRALDQVLLHLLSVCLVPVTPDEFYMGQLMTLLSPVWKGTLTLRMMDEAMERLRHDGLVNPRGECHPELREPLLQEAVRSGMFLHLAEVVRTAFHPRSSRLSYSVDDGMEMRRRYVMLLRDVRIAVHMNNEEQVRSCLNTLNTQAPWALLRGEPVFAAIGVWSHRAYDVDWWYRRCTWTQLEAVRERLEYGLVRCEPMEDVAALLQRHLDHPEQAGYGLPIFCARLAELSLWRGDLARIDAMVTACGEGVDLGAFAGCVAFLRGSTATGLEAMVDGLHRVRKQARSRNATFNDIRGVLMILALIKGGKPADREYARELAMTALDAGTPLDTLFAPLLALLRGLRCEEINRDGQILLSSALLTQESRVGVLFQFLAFYWLDLPEAGRHADMLVELHHQFRRTGYDWLAMESGFLLAALLGQAGTEFREEAEAIRSRLQVESILDVLHQVNAWEQVVYALEDMAGIHSGDARSGSGRQSEKRLAWMLQPRISRGALPSSVHQVGIQPKEQVLGQQGTWSKGRNIALKRLVSEAHQMPFLSDQDHVLIRASVTMRHSDHYYSPHEYHFDMEKLMPLLAGHPHVFLDSQPPVRVEVLCSEPELFVQESKGMIALQLSEKIGNEDTVRLVWETPTRCRVLQIRPEHHRLMQIIGAKGIKLPAQARESLLKAVGRIASTVTVHSSIAGEGLTAATIVDADTTPRIHLLPHGAGLRVRIVVQPFAQGGPLFQPGGGGKVVFAEIDGVRYQTTRALRQERARADELVSLCPLPEEGDLSNMEWLLSDPEECLDLLATVQSLGEKTTVHWPEGERIRISRPMSFEQLSLRVSSGQNWFQLDGELTVDEGKVIAMSHLLALLDASKGRFVPLGEGTFLTLTHEFQRRLLEMNAFTETRNGKSRFHPLAASVMQEFIADAGELAVDARWQRHLDHLQAAQSIEPVLPSTLQAELRDYQFQGFRWLVRLAAWGVGACLADDMGLGKTMQALALLLERAGQGPSLVVAPLSVTVNWVDEAVRFAPTLRVCVYSGPRRQDLLDSLANLDLVVCSYGLLQQDIDRLSTIQWGTVVLDEAQAIKNGVTKRSQAAMALQGGFRLITTGTPIENSLSELWNLFRFINPGLLGSRERFNTEYAVPIEKRGDRGAAQRLKKLIQPFMLRRTKNQVLEQLPSRTEIMLHVEMGEDEFAMYEALRQRAMETLAQLRGPVEQQRLQILAEITRLRRFCCNSRLVVPEQTVGSAKLALFSEVVTELLANRHKALVFSQFVDHLAILREHLDQQRIAYQYLDGSTPVRDRRERVDAFQSGRGDLFLISLKAGGTGLNLTAADYVIHMDPWWNPAVEDQASDRAHRIGQERPVTIYRLITRNTIEEKILQLHQHKRNLADDLLDGNDMSGRVSADDLLQLIRQGTSL